MTTDKTNKLKCIVTGRQLIATKAYYKRKVEKIGSVEELHRTYICREAKNLLRQGLTVQRVRQILDVDFKTVNEHIDQQIINDVLSEQTATRLNRVNSIIKTNNIVNNNTDPSVTQFIKKIIKSES